MRWPSANSEPKSWMVAHGVNIAGIILLLLIARGLEAFDKRGGAQRPMAASGSASAVADNGRESARLA